MILSAFSLEGKVAVVTGCDTGSRQLLSAYVGTRTKTASGSGARADIAPKSHYCR